MPTGLGCGQDPKGTECNEKLLGDLASGLVLALGALEFWT